MSATDVAHQHPALDITNDDETDNIVMVYDTRLNGGLEVAQQYAEALHEMGFGSEISDYHEVQFNEDIDDEVTIRF